MSGHVFVVGADLTRLSCDDVLVPTDRDAAGGARLVPAAPRRGGLHRRRRRGLRRPGVGGRGAGPRGAARGIASAPWLVDTDGRRRSGLSWLLDGAREALAAVARREVTEPAHGRARRLVGLPALGTGWGGAAGERGALLQQLLPVLREAAAEHGFDVALVLRRAQRPGRRPAGPPGRGRRLGPAAAPGRAGGAAGGAGAARAAGRLHRRRGERGGGAAHLGAVWSTSWPSGRVWTASCGPGSGEAAAAGLRGAGGPRARPRAAGSRTSRSDSGRGRTRWRTR